MSEYVLGQSDEALKRLIDQAAYLRPLTERMLVSAGLRSGMRVLDVGCGVGDVTFLAAEIVGPDGRVSGLDRAPEAIRMARRRAAERSIDNVDFLVEDEGGIKSDDAYDAIVGRYVLIYQPDAVAFVHRLVGALKGGGVLALQEVDFTKPILTRPALPVTDRLMAGIVAIMRETAADPEAAFRLPSILAGAGLGTPMGFCDRPLGTKGADTFFRWAASSYAVLQPRIDPDAEAVDVEQLAQDLMAEVASSDGCALGPDQWCVWARKTKSPSGKS